MLQLRQIELGRSESSSGNCTAPAVRKINEALTEPIEQAHRWSLHMIPRTRRRYQFEWILLGVALLTLGALLGYSVYAEHGEIRALEEDRLQVQARVIAENIESQLQGVNNALVGVRADLLRWDGKKMSLAPSRRLNVLSDVMPGVRTFIVLDAGGAVLASNRDELIGRNFSERDYFKVPRERPDPAVLYVSPPFKTVLGVVVISMT